MQTDLKAGDGLTLDWLNGVSDAARSGRPTYDGSSGVVGVEIPGAGVSGAVVRDVSGWFRVEKHEGEGLYTLQQVLPAPDGAWVDGPRRVAGREAGDSQTVTEGRRVWAFRFLATWRFQFGACP